MNKTFSKLEWWPNPNHYVISIYSNIKNLKCNIYCCNALKPHQCTSLVHSVHLGPFALLQPISVHFALFGLYIKRWVTPKSGGLFKTPHPPRKIYYWHRRCAENGLCSCVQQWDGPSHIVAMFSIKGRIGGWSNKSIQKMAKYPEIFLNGIWKRGWELQPRRVGEDCFSLVLAWQLW